MAKAKKADEATSQGTNKAGGIGSAQDLIPDGRSLGDIHDFIWQVAALILGTYPLSALEFDAIFGQLCRSTRRWALRPISRNYVSYLREALTEAA